MTNQNKLLTTNLQGYFKDKDNGFIINKNKHELMTVKQSIKNYKLAKTNEDKVIKLEDEVKQLKELLLQVIERK
jgi:hypothetical protein